MSFRKSLIFYLSFWETVPYFNIKIFLKIKVFIKSVQLLEKNKNFSFVLLKILLIKEILIVTLFPSSYDKYSNAFREFDLLNRHVKFIKITKD